MKHFLIALGGPQSKEIYEALCRGEDLLPAPAPCDGRVLLDMHSGRETPYDERPLALLHMEGLGFVASCQLFATYGERHKDPVRRRCIQIRRNSLRPFKEVVPLEIVNRSGVGPTAPSTRDLGLGVLRVDEKFYRAVLERSGPRAEQARGRSWSRDAMPTGTGPSDNSSANGTTSDAPQAYEGRSATAAPEDARALGSRYGRRCPGQRADEKYRGLVSQAIRPRGPLLAFAKADKVAADFRRRLDILNEADGYKTGAQGEQEVGAVLDSLGYGYFVFHDLPIRDRFGRMRENVDHVVIGIGGLFAVETKNLTGKTLVATKGEARNEPFYHDAESYLDKGIEQARRAAAFLEEILPVRAGSVEPIVCLNRGFVIGDGVVPEDHKGVAVHILARGQLPYHIRVRPTLLDHAVARSLAESLRESED